MIFTELVLENFGPYRGKHVIDLRPETANNPRPIILFGGMNGGGKTTLMDAIRLALYGQRAQCSARMNLSYNEFLCQSINQQTPPEEKTRIELGFEHVRDDQWVELKIVRYWSRNIKDGKDNLGILDNDWPDYGLANTWDEYIETLLPLGISNLFLFDGEQVKELAEQENPPQSVIDSIQALLGLELAEKLAIDLDILVNRKRKSLAEAMQLSDLEKIEVKLTELYQQEQKAKVNLLELQNQLQTAQIQLNEATNKFRVEGGRLAAQKSQLEKQKKDLEAAIETKQEALRKLAADVLPCGLIIPLLQQTHQQAQQELKLQKAKAALEILQQRDQRLLAYLTAITIKDEQLTKINEFLEQENRTLIKETTPETPPYLDMDEDTFKRLDNLLGERLVVQLKSTQNILDDLNQLQSELVATEKQLSVAASPEDYQKLDEILRKAQKGFLEAQAAYNEGNRHCEQIKKSIEKTKKELQIYSEKAIDRTNDEHLIKASARVKQTLQLFREKLTLKKLNKLEGEVTECFRYLLHKSDLVKQVVIDTKNFSLSLFDFNGQRLPKHRLSAGEKQMLAIAFLWGLARVSGRNLPLAIDTPLGRLDSSHRSHLVERYFPTASHQVILLSTDTEITQTEVTKLRELKAIAKQYLLKYDSQESQTTIYPDCYFF